MPSPVSSSATDQFTVKVIALLVPPGVITRTVLGPVVAPEGIVISAVSEVELRTTTLPATTPVPPIDRLVPAAVKLVPVTVTDTTVPRAPDAGVIDATVGGGGLITVNVTALLVPPDVATVTFLAVSAAKGPTVKVAVI